MQTLAKTRTGLLMATILGVAKEERMEEADQIIFLNFSSWSFVSLRRYLKAIEAVRESMAAGLPWTIQLVYPLDSLGWSQPTQNQYKRICLDYTEKLRLHNQRELDHL